MVAPQTRIAVALLLGSALVAGAFVVHQHSIPRQQNTAAISIAAPAERTYIDVKDSDGNGIPDWQEALQTTDPIIVPTTTASTAYEAPTTVTGKFAQTFFEDYMRSKIYGGLGGTQADLIQQETAKLAQQATDQLFTEKDISIFSSSDTQTLHDYGNTVAGIILAYPNSGDNELTLLEDAVRFKESDKLEELALIETAYTAMVKDMLTTPVPQKYVKQHLDLTNALNAVREDVHAMHNVNEDPMYTLIRIKRYKEDVTGLSNALSNLFGALYLQDNVRWGNGEPVSQLITFPQ